MEWGECLTRDSLNLARAVDDGDFTTAAHLLQERALQAGLDALSAAAQLGPLPNCVTQPLDTLLHALQAADDQHAVGRETVDASTARSSAPSVVGDRPLT